MGISTSSDRIWHRTIRLMGDLTGCCFISSWFNFVYYVAETSAIERLGIIRFSFLCRKSCIESLRSEL